MTFTIPEFKELTASAQKIHTTYKSERSDMDAQRFFSSYRASTINQERLNATACIQKIATYISTNKFNWDTIDQTFKQKDYAKITAPFLKKAISGALVLELITITATYSNEATVKTNSALGKIILDLFKIDKLSDIPPQEMQECLSNLNHFLEVTNKQLPQISWHETLRNSELMQQIDNEINNTSLLVL